MMNPEDEMPIAILVFVFFFLAAPMSFSGEEKTGFPIHKKGEPFKHISAKNQLYDPTVSVEPGGSFGEVFVSFTQQFPALFNAEEIPEPGGAWGEIFVHYQPQYPLLYDASIPVEPGGAYNTQFEPYRHAGEVFIDPENMPEPGGYWTAPTPGSL